jgi:uncharacterized protein involved in exopolysaccharide biosynthesis
VSRDSDLLDDEQPTSSGRPGLPVDVHRFVRALGRGKWWLVLAGLLGAVLGLAVGKFGVRHTYESTASIRYEGRVGQTTMDQQRDLPSLVSIAHSESMMIALRERIGLEEASIELMRQLVTVDSDPNSGLVSFTTAAESPGAAAEMANTIAALFLEHHRERRTRELGAEIASLEQRIQAAEGELARARQRYDGFRETHQITDLSAEQEQAITQAAELRSQADLAEAEIRALEARLAQLQLAIQRTPRTQAVSSGPSDDARRLQELQAQLSQSRSTLSDEHPQVQALQRQVVSLQRQLQRGGGTSTTMAVNTLHDQLRQNAAEAEAELEATRRRHQSLEQLAVQAQARTNRFSTIEGQAANLLAHVNVKQALVTELTQEKARAEDGLRDVSTGFRTVADARPPESAVRSKKKYIVAAAIPMAFLSIMFGMLLYRELRGLRVQTPVEVAWWGNGPVIGATTWPRDPRALIDLIADMDDHAPEARGTMLVVGSTEAERELAGEIAGQLNHDWSSTTLIDVPVIGSLPPPRSAPPMERDEEEDEEEGDDDDYYEDDPISGEIHDGPTELMLAPSMGLELDVMGAATQISAYAPPAPRDIDDPAERLICTAWNGPCEGQALRRAARLADRVLVVVTSNGLKAVELAQMKSRLGRERAVGYVLVGVSDDIARLPDRAGRVEEFWEGGAAR